MRNKDRLDLLCKLINDCSDTLLKIGTYHLNDITIDFALSNLITDAQSLKVSLMTIINYLDEQKALKEMKEDKKRGS